MKSLPSISHNISKFPCKCILLRLNICTHWEAPIVWLNWREYQDLLRNAVGLLKYWTCSCILVFLVFLLKFNIQFKSKHMLPMLNRARDCLLKCSNRSGYRDKNAPACSKWVGYKNSPKVIISYVIINPYFINICQILHIIESNNISEED